MPSLTQLETPRSSHIQFQPLNAEKALQLASWARTGDGEAKAVQIREVGNAAAAGAVEARGAIEFTMEAGEFE